MKSTAKKVLVFLFSLLALVPPGRAAGPAPRINAAAAVLMDAASREVLYAKNPHAIRPPASLTKIMTAVLALEKADLNDVVWVSPIASARTGSSMGLVRGEALTLEDLLYGMMLVSGNDAAAVIAEHIAGTEWDFARLMRAKAEELGLENTGFMNACGLPAYGHYSTAYVLALLTCYALENPVFARIVQTKEKTVSGRRAARTRKLVNSNKLLWQYSYATGVKTGYTSSAGRCLAASATCRGVTLVAVVLNSSTTYEDAKKLFEYGFAGRPATVKADPVSP